MTRIRLLSALSALLVTLIAAQDVLAAGKRHAIVVGNSDYTEVPKLATAVNDARETRKVLEGLGFTVEFVENGTKRQIGRALAKVENAVEPGDSVLFHFAGHGFEIDGHNWLLPVDVPAAKRGEAGLVKDESFNASAVVDRFRARGAGTVIAILDACRDNPFAQGGAGALAGSGGLARMDAAGGVFILFSAGAKQLALDRLSPGDTVQTSIFARTFLPLLADRRMTLSDLAKETQERVGTLARSVGHEQLPAHYSGITGRIGVVGDVTAESAKPTAPVASAGPSDSAEDRFWRSVESKDDAASYRAYLDEVERRAFPGTYRRLAELRLSALTSQAKPAATSSTARTATAPPVQEATGPEIEACDRAAAAPDDPEKPANIPGVDFKVLSPPPAVSACLKALAVPGVPRRIYFQLGRAYNKLRNMREALVNYHKAAELKHGRAMYNLAVLQENGDGIKRDYGLARTFYEGAASAGVTQGLFAIGLMYHTGKGVPVDYAKARSFYERAIAGGEPLAYANLGNLYGQGKGVPRNRDKACEYYRLGANAGEPVATKNMNRSCRPR